MLSRTVVCRSFFYGQQRCRGQAPWLRVAFSSKAPSPDPSKLEPSTVRRIWRLMFGRYLLVTNTVSSGVLMMLGDIAAQEIEMRRDHAVPSTGYDWRRVFNMTLVGISQGPLHHYLYKWMDVLLPGASVRTVFKKIGIDQFVISPIFIITYLYSAGLLEGASFTTCTDEIKNKYWTIYMADWLVWPPTQFINFYLLSPKYRVLYINGITMLYNVFLCYIKHNDDLVSLITGGAGGDAGEKKKTAKDS
ncbi:pmp22 peroxisomal membrane protein [Anopheles sinensis]|uniref:Pmp22 peroxisomal membrane protein n=1 Tax=Anopheles sinensis TaxID=74873 RepID=A0A084WIB2_ANOSI|nr:pmp22 peroxisomal membrane protein [Anopheles sinensis]